MRELTGTFYIFKPFTFNDFNGPHIYMNLYRVFFVLPLFVFGSDYI